MLRESRVVLTVRYTADREPSPELWAWHADVGGQRVAAERCEAERAAVHVVVTADSEDPVFAFARAEDAAAFAATYGALDATDYGETPVIGPELAAEMIAERQEPTELEQSA